MRHTVNSPDTDESATVSVERYEDGVQVHIGHPFADAAAAMSKVQAIEIGNDLIRTASAAGRTSIRVRGENVKKGDTVAVTFATERTVALVGLVGDVTRIRAYDEESGIPVSKIDSGKPNPELWFRDHRTGAEVGPIEREEIHSIAQIDGPWITPNEMRAMGHDPGPQDCADNA
jgi:hypothetical protein